MQVSQFTGCCVRHRKLWSGLYVKCPPFLSDCKQLVYVTTTKFHQSPSNRSPADICGRTDGRALRDYASAPKIPDCLERNIMFWHYGKWYEIQTLLKMWVFQKVMQWWWVGLEVLANKMLQTNQIEIHKVTFNLQQATKVQRGSRGTALPFL